MRASFTVRQTFVVAVGVGLAVAVAPLGVEAAKRTARAIAVDKKGQAKVVVTNRPAVRVRGGVAVSNEPSVKVPGGVAVTNEPNVKVPGGVAVTNQPTVNVANQPTEISVKSEPGKLSATTRPPLEDVFNFYVGDVQNLTPRSILELPAGRSAAITNVAVAVHNFGTPVDEPTVADVVRYVRTSGSSACGSAGWTATVLRRLVIKTDETVALDMAAAPLLAGPEPGGADVCVAMKLYQWVSETKVVFMADGYQF